MKLMGNLKKQVDGTDTKDGKNSAFKKSGMILTDDELGMVSGGTGGGDELKPAEGGAWFKPYDGPRM